MIAGHALPPQAQRKQRSEGGNSWPKAEPKPDDLRISPRPRIVVAIGRIDSHARIEQRAEVLGRQHRLLRPDRRMRPWRRRMTREISGTISSM